MTKEQREEMERLAHDFCERHHLGSHEYPNKAIGFQAGFTAGVESEKRRAQVLVKALELILARSKEGYVSFCGLPEPEDKAVKSLAQYKKGGGDE